MPDPRDTSRATKAEGSQGGSTLCLAGLEVTWPAALPRSTTAGQGWELTFCSQHRMENSALGGPGKGLTCQGRLHAEPTKQIKRVVSPSQAELLMKPPFCMKHLAVLPENQGGSKSISTEKPHLPALTAHCQHSRFSSVE